MRLLLDSHVFVWAKCAPEILREESRAAIIDPENEAFVSVATAWELWLKHAKKPIAGFAAVLDSGAAGFLEAARASRITLLEISLQHCAKAAALPMVHRDPFDRMLIAQAVTNGLTVVTGDPAFSLYKGLRVLEA
jgi:PIN domain nuclease of toxin-antitoxin system